MALPQYTLQLFGPLAGAAGTRTLVLTLASPNPIAADLRAAAIAAHPTLAKYLEPSASKARFAINHEFVDDTALIKPSDEIALIGAVSGGT